MNLTSLLKQGFRAVQKNSPAILTGLGVAGVVATAYFAHEAGAKTRSLIALETMKREVDENPVDLTPKEIFELTWHHYIPPVLMAATTVTCIIGAHNISARRNAALLGMYTLAEKSATVWQEKTEEIAGKETTSKIRDEIARESVEANPPGSYTTSGSKIMTQESITKRWIPVSVETIRRAVNEVNAIIVAEGSACLNEFYQRIGLETTDMGFQMGWHRDRGLMDVYIIPVMDGEDNIVNTIGYNPEPYFDFDSIWG